MRYLLLLFLFGCSMENIQYNLGLGTAGKIITVLVDEDYLAEKKVEEYYFKLGDKTYKVIADRDKNSIITFECYRCGLKFGIKPSETDLENMGVLVCPRCRSTIAVLHDIEK